jgi:hypothetical protein
MALSPLEIPDFGSTHGPAWLSAILSCFGPKEICFFRENMISTPVVLWPDDAV